MVLPNIQNVLETLKSTEENVRISFANFTGIVLPKGPIGTISDIIETNSLPKLNLPDVSQLPLGNLPTPPQLPGWPVPNVFNTQNVNDAPTDLDVEVFIPESVATLDVEPLEPEDYFNPKEMGVGGTDIVSGEEGLDTITSDVKGQPQNKESQFINSNDAF